MTTAQSATDWVLIPSRPKFGAIKMAIPKNCRIDLYFPADDRDKRHQVQSIINDTLAAFNYTLIASGYALHYQNFMLAAEPEGVQRLKAALAPIEGVYFNEYPPEILREMYPILNSD
jgi:hypothetical protein